MILASIAPGQSKVKTVGEEVPRLPICLHPGQMIILVLERLEIILQKA